MSPWANVSRFVDRHGHERWRYRRKGFPSAMLPGEPGSPDFMAALEQARKAPRIDAGEQKTEPGTISDLCVQFYRSALWRALSPVTQRTYRGEIERFRARAGALPFAKMRRAHVLRLLDAKAATPAAANQLLRVLRLMFRFALDRELVSADPTYMVKKLKPENDDGFTPWTEADIAQYQARWPSGSKPRLALELMLETGVRRGDAVRLGRAHVSGGKVRLRQSKTGGAVVVPLSQILAAEIAHAPRDQLTFLATDYGRPFTANGFGNWFRAKARAAGLAGLSAHGLRKAAARRLAENGCTPSEIMAVTGHTSLSEVTRYTESADRERNAERAYAKAGKGTDLSTRDMPVIVNPRKKGGNPG